MAGRHKGNTTGFGDETFAEQAKTITASINNLQAAIRRHIVDSPRRQQTTVKCLAQIQRLLGRLQARYRTR